MALFIVVGVSASVISVFVTVPSLVTCIYWLIRKVRIRRHKKAPISDANGNRTNSVSANVGSRGSTSMRDRGQTHSEGSRSASMQVMANNII